jgi:hypothetical protein
VSTINMYQSSPRKNFLDTLTDPTTIALLGSIALHALIGASLPFFHQLEQEGKKADPGTVKVVELTPSELQRIPQAPPTPKPQVFAPPTIPSTKVVTPPSTPPISPNSPTVPFSPIRIPLEKITPQPPKGRKDQQPTPQSQPKTPIFDPKISFKPTPKNSQSPTPDKLKPTPKPTPVVTKPQVTNPTIPFKNSDDDGGEFQAVTPTITPSQPAQSTNPTRPAGGSAPVKPAGQPSGQSSGQSSGIGGDGNSAFPYAYGGKYAAAVEARIARYRKDHPGIKVYTVSIPPSIPYPPNLVCRKAGQAPFSVLLVAFDKVPNNAENSALGTTSAPSVDEPYVATDRDTPENRELGRIAIETAIYAANKADQSRPAADKGKRVLYQYRVQFDPTTCKK